MAYSVEICSWSKPQALSSCVYIYWVPTVCFGGLPKWLSGKRICLPVQKTWFHPWVGKIPGRREWQPTAVFLLGKSHGQRSLVGYAVHGVAKGWTQLSGQHTPCAVYGGDCWDIEMERPSPWPSLESSAAGIRM